MSAPRPFITSEGSTVIISGGITFHPVGFAFIRPGHASPEGGDCIFYGSCPKPWQLIKWYKLCRVIAALFKGSEVAS